jgi:hypothetical protein
MDAWNLLRSLISWFPLELDKRPMVPVQEVVGQTVPGSDTLFSDVANVVAAICCLSPEMEYRFQ